eukprot:2831655-Prymnesium_polylepis.1
MALSSLAPAALAAAPCELAAGFSYATEASPPPAFVSAATLPWGPLCTEHRWKLRPDCTWRHEQTADLLCPCDTTVRGLSVRYSRIGRGDRDWYDFKLLCGESQPVWGGRSALAFEIDSNRSTRLAAAVCPDGQGVTALQHSHRRHSWGDVDLYGFGLRCAARDGNSTSVQPLNLHGASSPTSVTSDGVGCGAGQHARGLRIRRAFQGDGDVDREPRVAFEQWRAGHSLPACAWAAPTGPARGEMPACATGTAQKATGALSRDGGLRGARRACAQSITSRSR